jgi:hypothetical protein
MRGVKTVYIANFVNTHAGCTTIILKFVSYIKRSYKNVFIELMENNLPLLYL